jgi:hypothetical protein
VKSKKSLIRSDVVVKHPNLAIDDERCETRTSCVAFTSDLDVYLD